jgi:uncharacterized membrane protein
LKHIVASRQSGYVQFVDLGLLNALAKSYGICLRLERRVGQFIPAGGALLRTTRGERISEERALQLLAAIDLGPIRTMQQDIEFGIVQIVDIALRAISPAVNDPTTAIARSISLALSLSGGLTVIHRGAITTIRRTFSA